VFALLFLAVPNGIANARPGSFIDHYAFAVQTSATIGYGAMAPARPAAHILVTVLSYLGTLYTATLTGVVVAKFARPTARVLFAEKLVLFEVDGHPQLQLRMANARGNQMVEARVRVSILRNEVSGHGQMRRIRDLKLVRNETAAFNLTWTVMHDIEPDSPLRGETPESVLASQTLVTVTILGLDETTGQTVHARRAYQPADIAWGHRYVDVIETLPDGRRRIDYTRFHDTVPT
jgi:inward rectifier potassium channel